MEKIDESKSITQKERHSGIELLRILSMLSIVIGHFSKQGGFYDALEGGNLFCAYLFGSFLRYSVGIFVIIACFFMVDKKFKASRVLNVYFELLFYSLLLFVLMKVLGVHLTALQTVRSIFPLISFALWFVSTYICLLFISPFLQKIIMWDKNVFLKFLTVLSAFFIVLIFLGIRAGGRSFCIFSFIYIYFCIGYFKKYIYKKVRLNKYVLLLSSILIYALFATLRYFCSNSNPALCESLTEMCILNYTSIFALFCAFSIFYFFLNTNFKGGKIINFISKPALSVYIIHQAPCFRDYMFYNVLNCGYWQYSKYAVFYILYASVAIYCGCFLIDILRKKYIEPFLTNSKVYKFLENTLNKFYQDI